MYTKHFKKRLKERGKPNGELHFFGYGKNGEKKYVSENGMTVVKKGNRYLTTY